VNSPHECDEANRDTESDCNTLYRADCQVKLVDLRVQPHQLALVKAFHQEKDGSRDCSLNYEAAAET